MFMESNSLILEIEQELERRGWAKSDFCERLNISTQAYNNWRNRGIPSRRIADVATLFGWDINKLLKGETGIKEVTAQYNGLSDEARSLARRWQALPPHLQQHILKLLDATEQMLSGKKDRK